MILCSAGVYTPSVSYASTSLPIIMNYRRKEPLRRRQDTSTAHRCRGVYMVNETPKATSSCIPDRPHLNTARHANQIAETKTTREVTQRCNEALCLRMTLKQFRKKPYFVHCETAFTGYMRSELQLQCDGDGAAPSDILALCCRFYV